MSAAWLPTRVALLVMAPLMFLACDTPEGPHRPTIEIHGSVTDSVENTPIDRALICVTDYDIVLGIDTVAMVYSDSEGRYSRTFTIHPSCEQLSLTVEKEGYYPKGAAPVNCAEGIYVRNFRLVPAELTFEVHGTVTDAVQSTPIELATVSVTRWREHIGLDTLAVVYTDSQGSYSDTFTVYHACEPPPRLILNVNVEKEGYHSAFENLQCAEGVHTLDFQLVPWR